MQVLDAGAEAPTGCPVSLIDESTSVYMQLGEGDVDHGKELEKHLKEQVTNFRACHQIKVLNCTGTWKESGRLCCCASSCSSKAMWIAKLQLTWLNHQLPN